MRALTEPPELKMSESRKRLALAIVRHLQSELNDGLVESDAEDSMQG